MVIIDKKLVTANGTVPIEENVIGFSIEPSSDNDDGFTYGINTDSPDIHVNSGDGGKDFGFQNCEYGFMKPGVISIAFDGNGIRPEALIIFTKFQAD